MLDPEDPAVFKAETTQRHHRVMSPNRKSPLKINAQLVSSQPIPTSCRPTSGTKVIKILADLL
jgi:hypothetical protein